MFKLTSKDYEYLQPIAEAYFLRNSRHIYLPLLAESASPIEKRALVEALFMVSEDRYTNMKSSGRVLRKGIDNAVKNNNVEEIVKRIVSSSHNTLHTIINAISESTMRYVNINSNKIFDVEKDVEQLSQDQRKQYDRIHTLEKTTHKISSDVKQVVNKLSKSVSDLKHHVDTQTLATVNKIDETVEFVDKQVSDINNRLDAAYEGIIVNTYNVDRIQGHITLLYIVIAVLFIVIFRKFLWKLLKFVWKLIKLPFILVYRGCRWVISKVKEIIGRKSIETGEEYAETNI